VSGKPACNIWPAFNIWLSDDFRMRRSLAQVHLNLSPARFAAS
jgi:hypothetical protein